LPFHDAICIRLGGKVVLDGVLRTRFFGDIDDRFADRQPGLAGGAQIIEIVRDLVKLLRADDQVDVG
jgi:hypothetical protein